MITAPTSPAPQIQLWPSDLPLETLIRRRIPAAIEAGLIRSMHLVLTLVDPLAAAASDPTEGNYVITKPA